MERINIIRNIEALESAPKDTIKNLEDKISLTLPPKSYAEAFNLYLYGRAFLLLGKQELSIRPLNLALNYFKKVYSKFGRFYCYTNLGIAYRELKERKLSIDSFEKAYHLSYEMEDFAYLIKALMNLGSIYADLEDCTKALEMLDKALEYESYVAGTKTLGDLYNNYAYVLLGVGESQQALEYLIKAKSVYDGYYKDHKHINTIIVETNIGETYLTLMEFSKAEEYLKSAILSAEQQNMDFILLDSKLNLSKVYEAQGRSREALDVYREYVMLRNQIESIENIEEIEELKEKLQAETARSEMEIDRLRNVELKAKTQELEKTLKNLSLIGKIGQSLTSSMDMDEIYAILRKSIYNLMHADIFGLALYDESNEKIIYKYFENKGQPMPLMEVGLHDPNALTAYAIYHEEDIMIKDFRTEYSNYIELISPVGMDSDADHAKCIIYCRLLSEGRVIGLITLQNYEANSYNESDFEVVKALASYVAIAISNSQKKNLISEKAKELEYLSYYDPLTGLCNRRQFNDNLSSIIDNDHMPLGIIVADMNNLKRINDKHGHLFGDQYLIEASKILQSSTTSTFVYRLGGDEFAILLPKTSELELKQIVKAIQLKASQINLVGEPLSLALGSELMNVLESSDLQTLFSRAETRMYHDKSKYKMNKIQ